MNHNEDNYEYDVAFTFAGEDRDYVKSVAYILKNKGVKIYYDEFEQIQFWGENLCEYFNNIYRNKARYCIMFISKHYANKLWTNHERQSAQARAFEDNNTYILPARFDDTEIPGILPTTGYIDIAKMKPVVFAENIIIKINGSNQASKQPTKPSEDKFCETPSTYRKCFYFEKEENLATGNNSDFSYTEEKALYLRLIPTRRLEKAVSLTSSLLRQIEEVSRTSSLLRQIEEVSSTSFLAKCREEVSRTSSFHNIVKHINNIRWILWH